MDFKRRSEMKYKVTKSYCDGDIIEAQYIYRGFTFDRRDSVPSGYFGRYEVIFTNKLTQRSFSTLGKLKKYIDEYMDNKK